MASIRGGRFDYFQILIFECVSLWCRCSLWKHKTYESCLSTQLVFFLHRSLSSAFILKSAFFFSSSSPSLLFYCNSFVHPSISNCFQYQLLGILLSGISPVGCYPLVTTPTHCLDNPLSSKQWSTIQHQC